MSGSVLERLEPEVQLPYDEDAMKSGEPIRQAEYLLELVKTLQELLVNLVTVANYLVDLTDGEAVYVGVRNKAGEYPNGTWRFIKNGDNLERQVKIAGTWIYTGDWERPI